MSGILGRSESRSTLHRAQAMGVLTTLAVLISAAVTITLAPSAVASRDCPSAAVAGKPIGWITVDGTRVPIAPVGYPAGGALDPPATSLAAGLSTRHRPLTAKTGTSVLTWHVRYGKGCDGALNALIDLPVGSTFTVEPAGGAAQAYRIIDRVTVPKGRYRARWFDLSGPRRLALFTCTGLKNGSFTQTVAVFASPIAPA